MDYCKDCDLWERRSPWVGKCSEWATTKEGPPFTIASKTCRRLYTMGENILTPEQFGCPAWQERQKPFTAHGDVIRYNRDGKIVTDIDLWFGDADTDAQAQAICKWLNSLWPESSSSDLHEVTK